MTSHELRKDDLCLNCNTGFHKRSLHNQDGCQVVGCSCKLNCYMPCGDVREAQQ